MEVHIPELADILSQMKALTLEVSHLKGLLSSNQNKPYLTATEVAKELKFSEVTIKNWINQGRRHPQTRKLVKLPCVKSEGGHYRIQRADLEVFKTTFTTK